MIPNGNNDNDKPKTNEQQKRKIFWFNVPFSKNIATGMEKHFRNLNSTNFSTETIWKLVAAACQILNQS